MTKKAYIKPLIISIILTLFLAILPAYAWFGTPSNAFNVKVKGSMVEEYFHCGSGKEDDPFVITRPVHYYHLVEFFQRTTQLPVVYNSEDDVVDFGNEYLYFQIGCPEEQLYDPSLRPTVTPDTSFYVFEYGNAGQLIKDQDTRGNKDVILNMAYYSGDNALMPIGTSEVPFYGSFNGNNLTVTNLNIITEEDVVVTTGGESQTVTRQTSDIGIFGYIGTNGVLSNVYFKNVNISLVGGAANATIDTSVTNISHTSSHPDTVYVGYLVGHTNLSTSVVNVFVNNCTIKGGAASTCNFGYFGLVDDSLGQPITTLGEEIATQFGSGNEPGWGGSMDMNTLYTRILSVKGNAANPCTYPTATTVTIDEVANTYNREVTATATASAPSGSSVSWVHYESTLGGSYYFRNRTDTNRFLYLSGENRYQKQTITTYRYLDEFTPAYHIASGSNYLSTNGIGITNATSEATASAWVLNDANHLYTIYDGTKYYLRQDTDLTLTVSTMPSTTWTKDGNDLYCTNSGTNYYLTYFDSWFLITTKGRYKVKDASNNYLVMTASSISSTTSEGAATSLIYNGSSGTISTFVSGTQYYLNGTNTLAVSSTSAGTNWQFAGNNLSYSYGGQIYYLVYLNNAWQVLPAATSYQFGDGNGNYLSADTQGITNSSTASESVWFYNGSSGVIATYIDGNFYYLNRNGKLSTTSDNTVWTYSTNRLSYTYNASTYYLYYNGSVWTVNSTSSYYLISDGSGHYLNVSNGSLVAGTSSSTATHWIYNGSNGTISFNENGNVYYLNRGAKLSTTSDNTNWTFSGGNRLSYTYNGRTFYLYYTNQNWIAAAAAYKIHDGANHFLNLSSGTLSTGDNLASATIWFYAGNGSEILTVDNGVVYYLYGTAYNLSASTSNSTLWNFSSNYLNYSYNGFNYRLRYDNGWKIYNSDLSYYKISDNRGHYLSNNGTDVVSTSNAASATIWGFDASGNVSVDIGESTYYLNSNMSNNALVTLGTSGQSWTYSANNLATGGYKLLYNNGSWIVNNDSNLYTIAYSGNYLSLNGTSVVNQTSQNEATLWTFSSTGSNPSGSISTGLNGTTYYLNRSGNWFSISTSSASWSNSGNKLYFSSGWSTYYIRYNKSWQIGTQNNKNVLSITSVNNTITRTEQTITPASITMVDQNIVPQIALSSGSENLNVTETGVSYQANIVSQANLIFSNTQLQTVTKTVETDKNSGNYTYIPLTLELQDEDDPTSYYTSDYRVANKNTGYIVSSGNEPGSYAADIRVSQYPMSSINVALNNQTPYNDNRLQVVTRTIETNGYVRVQDSYNATNINNYHSNLPSTYKTVAEAGLHKYESGDLELSRFGLSEMMNHDPNNVYGLHFMDAQIDINNVVVADQVTILGVTHYNYEMPQDCINFQTNDKGIINFFAGTYFPGNSTFFSLHQVFRDGQEKITAIKEIAEVYKSDDGNILKPYIYKFTDNTYTNFDGTYTGATSLISGYSLIFDTTWITNPSSFIQNAVYYFEVPCNKGEFALGSVDEKDGAYLFYLDIGTAGGDAIATTISGEGNDITDSFQVDFRDKPETSPYSLLQLAFDAPEATNDSFSVNVTFDSTGTSGGAYDNGLYTITIVNKTSSNVQFAVFLCDDDDNIYNDFEYAYKIIYTNNTETSETIMNGLYDFFKTSTIYTIPSSGPVA
ncbi:MAG: hypothetical protein ACOX0I_00035 [Bacilli bacterium]|jgi:hypothetical protein